MITYIVMIVTSLFFAFLEEKIENKKLKWFFAICTAIPFIVVSSIRYDVGTDYFFRYVPNYMAFVEGKDVDSLEILFKIIIKICVLFTNDYIILFFISSVIISILFIVGIKKFSRSFFISVLVFFIGSFFFQSLNIMRQYIAMSILFVSYKFIFNNKKIVFWIIFVIIASMYHTMSIIFAIAILLDKKIINYKLLFALLLFILILGKPTINLVLNAVALFNITNIAKYQHYIDQGGKLSISNIVVELTIYIYIMFIYYKNKKCGNVLDKEGIFFINIQTVALIFTIMNIYIDLFFRVQLLFSMFQIVSIPYFYNIGKQCINKKFKIKNINISANTIVFGCVLIIICSRMVYSNCIKGADEILPYKTILERRV